ncbi:dihydrodipicolinate synthase family protein [Natronobiforma cellulositropha]|uniref:dihydrodipicolinate synthase family protein n=1 Tax=Natronobiforma cellulositropha TaxID=1679076 RepID=UPI0021D5B4C8|nr:dihydrodipicolinate synthase family protein [Natronobiforma cellulositropha]
MSGEITGIVSPVLTPFDEEGNLVAEHIEASVDYALECGCHAIVAAGTGVQETAALTVEERKTVITETIDAVDGARPVLAGVSYPAQPVTDDLAAHAEAAGADGVLAMPPWGVAPSEDAIVRYFQGIAEATDLPMLVYNNPGVTIDMSKETMARVAEEVETVEYVKESLRDWQKIAWLFERIHHEGHAEVFTTMDVLLPTLQAVDTGVVTPAPLSTPAMGIYEAVQEGDLERAQQLQRLFGDFPPEAAQNGLTAVCKAAAQIAGVPVGDPRVPYDAVDAAGRDAIEAWMADADVPTVD